VDPDGPERAQWQMESAQESFRDVQWNQRHGPVRDGARVTQFDRPAEGYDLGQALLGRKNTDVG
jgi:hypothetical protein